MGRAEKRKALKAKPAWKRMTVEQRQAAWAKNGITAQDMIEEYDKGFNDGRTQGINQVGQTIYAALCLVLKERNGIDRDGCIELLKAVDDKVTYSLNSADEIQKVFDELKIRLDFADPIETIKDIKEV